MRLADAFNELERVAELVVHRLWAVSHDVEAAAFLWAVETE